MNAKETVAVFTAVVLAFVLLGLALKSCQEPVGPAPVEPTTEETTDVQPTVIETTTPPSPVIENDDSSPVIQYGGELPSTGGIKL